MAILAGQIRVEKAKNKNIEKYPSGKVLG